MKRLQQRIAALGIPRSARLSWSIRDLDSDEAIGVDADAVFRVASLIKLPVAVTVFAQADAGTLSLSERVELASVLSEDDSGILSLLHPGDASLSIRALAALMLCVSDNTASNLLIERIGIDAVNAHLDGLGLTELRLRRKLLDFAAAARGEENEGTTAALTALLALLARGKLLSPKSTAELTAILRQNAMSVLRRELPAGATSADKTGDLPGMRGSAGVLQVGERRACVAVLLDGLDDEPAAERFTAAFGREVAQWLSQPNAPR